MSGSQATVPVAAHGDPADPQAVLVAARAFMVGLVVAVVMWWCWACSRVRRAPDADASGSIDGSGAGAVGLSQRLTPAAAPPQTRVHAVCSRSIAHGLAYAVRASRTRVTSVARSVVRDRGSV